MEKCWVEILWVLCPPSEVSGAERGEEALVAAVAGVVSGDYHLVLGSDDDSFWVRDDTDATTKTQLSSSCVKFRLTPLGCSLDVCFQGGGSLSLLFKLHDTNLDSI